MPPCTTRQADKIWYLMHCLEDLTCLLLLNLPQRKDIHLLSATVLPVWNPACSRILQSLRSVILDGGSMPIWLVLEMGSGSFWKQDNKELSVMEEKSGYQKT